MSILKLENIVMMFGGIKAINNLSLEIEEGVIHGLIGPNGSGKTTTFDIISRTKNATEGKVIFDSQDITNVPLYKINKRGIARTFQHISLFNEMTVLENVMIGRHCRTQVGLFGSAVKTKKSKIEEKSILEKSCQFLEFVGLDKRAFEKAKHLSYGEQRLLEITRALASEPKLIMLDEASAGMNSTEKDRLIELIRQISKMDISILMIEHDMKLAMSLSDKITVLDYGSKIAEGLPVEIQNNPAVIEAYLGKGLDNVED